MRKEKLQDYAQRVLDYCEQNGSGTHRIDEPDFYCEFKCDADDVSRVGGDWDEVLIDYHIVSIDVETAGFGIENESEEDFSEDLEVEILNLLKYV